jgi:Ser/Thr protein kinase RdoA (MazF antagonist)
LSVALAEDFLPLWAETNGALATLINHSENHTFRVSGPRGRHILRLHRPGYQLLAAIDGELDWLRALQRDTDLPLPSPLAGSNGDLVQLSGGRAAVLFSFEPGREPQPGEDLLPLFKTLGRYAARLHNHVALWRPPIGFFRPRWDAAAILDVNGHWGDWCKAPGVGDPERLILDRLEQRLRSDLAAYGESADRFGLIHADMRLANLLVDGETITLIDFDDCGFGWFAYDFAAAVSFIETDPRIPALQAAWLDGYLPLRQLSPQDIAALETTVLLRRMALLAWIGSHSETDLAKSHAHDFASGTVSLAEAYLSRG